MKLKSLKRAFYKLFLLFPGSQNVLISLFNGKSDFIKEHLYDMVAKRPPKILRYSRNISISTWGSKVMCPLREGSFNRDWDLLFALGHDLEVKKQYRKMIRLKEVAKFVDVGANYGLHSMIFLSHKIPAVIVEPIPECVKRINLLCELNGYSPIIHNIAASNAVGSSVIAWPSSETWLGTLGSRISSKNYSHECEVKIDTIDNLGLIDGPNQLMKIDVEGHELEVIEGAKHSIQKWHPTIIFESFRETVIRTDIYNSLKSLNYSIEELSSISGSLRKQAFIISKCKNFLAKAAN